jgi:DNA replication protein DnaC
VRNEERRRPDETSAKNDACQREARFHHGEELLAWQKEQGEIRAAALARENRAMKMQRTFNRSGIRPLHQNCSFDNYKVETSGQMNALAAARQYVDEFDGNIASFIFSGKPGTGKTTLPPPSATSCFCAVNRCSSSPWPISCPP